MRYVDSATDFSMAEIALLIRQRCVTGLISIPPIPGEIMSDDISSALRLVTAPDSEPVTLAQAKTFLRIDSTADDDTVTTAIAAARQHAETYLRTALLPQVWDYAQANPCACSLQLPIGPAQSIASVTLTSELGVDTVMNAANYRLSVDGFVVFFTTAPSTEKITVRFSASSFDTVGDIPAPIIQGMLYHIAVMVENRDGAAALPAQSIQCYQPFRRIML